AKKYSNMDLNRVGIYGGSAGGQNTVSALLNYPEAYKVGVADCGCHDNRMDKIWWNELWMGWPIGPHYADNSNVTHAANLKGKLFLTVGELDRNVDPASTLQLVDALVKAEKDFDFMMIPGAGHGVGDSLPYLIKKREDFFVRHLYGLVPRRNEN
ncbi:S9 family peptidase, partial [bacterium]|nr:S9 family peptidase [bacterium]